MDDYSLDKISIETLFEIITGNQIGGYGKEFFTDYLKEYEHI